MGGADTPVGDEEPKCMLDFGCFAGEGARATRVTIKPAFAAESE